MMVIFDDSLQEIFFFFFVCCVKISINNRILKTTFRNLENLKKENVGGCRHM